MEPHDDGSGRSAGVDATPSSTATNASVAAALQELVGIVQLPLAEHPDAFARVHTGLQQALSDIDDA